MDFELLIALSHLRSRRQDAGVSLIAVLSVFGVTLGVGVLIVVLSVMEGFEIDLRKKILGNQAHMLVLAYGGPLEEPSAIADKVAALDEVKAVTPFSYSEVMLRSTYGISGAILKGIDPERALAVNDVAHDIEVGPRGEPTSDHERAAIVRTLHAPPPAVAQDIGDDEVIPGIILGTGLAEALRVYPGDKVHVINPIGAQTGPMGVPIPTIRTFRVAALVHSGMYEYDTKWSYITLGDAQEFMSLGTSATGLEVRVHEGRIWDVMDSSALVEMTLGPSYYTRNWLTMNEALFQALALEKWVMGIILAQIISVAALGIVTNLIVMVVTRGREISILRAMGATSSMLRKIFVIEGLTVGLVGTSLGVALGLASCAVLSRYKYPLDTNVYYIDSLPVVVVPSTVAVVAIGAVVVCLLATLYPASRAAALHPVDGLRYE
ncbi:MAG: FtsX-like permease family protein [Myxococcales bacterium]|nr:FtsX-like permease family protein [Myxococcales bacterium]